MTTPIWVQLFSLQITDLHRRASGQELTGLLTCQVLLIQSRTGVVLPALGWALQYQSLIKKPSHRWFIVKQREAISQLRVLSQGDFSLHETDKN